jgi:citrate lyase beta subunit
MNQEKTEKTKMSVARSVLSVPGSSQRFLDKAATSAAEVIMIDWEDGVAPADKAAGRELTLAFLTGTSVTRPTSDPRVWVRVNAPQTGEFARDAAAIDQWIKHDLRVPVVIPMSTLTSVKEAAARLPDLPLIAMIETAQGVEQATDIARIHNVTGLMFGEYDYLATMANSGSPRMTDTAWAKARLVNAAAAAGKWAIAGPTADFSDQEALQHQTTREADLGFSGKLCIHPSQLTTVNRAFSPAPAFLRWAEDLLAELGKSHPLDGAFNFRGQMVDPPVIDRARAAVRMAGESK